MDGFEVENALRTEQPSSVMVEDFEILTLAGD